MLKVGDKVRIKRGLEVNKDYNGVRFSDNMKNIKEGTIENVEDLGFREKSLIAYTMLENRYYWSEEMLEKIGEDNMKELTFKEVINNIREGEVWENCGENLVVNTISMVDGQIFIDLKQSRTAFGILGKFKLQRKQYTFQEAFELFEEGKEIESAYGTKYKFNKTTEEVTITETQYENRTTIYCFEDVLFRCDEIKCKWYIND